MKKDYLKEMKPYQPNQIETDIVLSANESQNYLFKDGYLFNKDTSKYPEANADSLRQALANKWKLKPNQFIIGNGSTELLELIVKTYVDQEEVVLSFDPSFSMYQIYANIYNAKYQTVPIENDGTMNINRMIDAANRWKPKLIFLCTPNNPTGSMVRREDIIKLLNQTEALVVVDEAYMDFAGDKETMIQDINHFEQLIIARTFSKAYGLAAFRLGYVVSNLDIINDLLSIKLPYNVNQSSIEIAKMALKQPQKVQKFIKGMIEARDTFIELLNQLPIEVFPSKGNFVFIKSKRNIYEILLQKSILIRAFDNDTYRITIGTPSEMNQVYQILKEELS